jgi:hypothetical protein
MVNHLVEGNLVFTALLEGVLPPERGLDRLGGDPVAAYRLLRCRPRLHVQVFCSEAILARWASAAAPRSCRSASPIC